MNIKGAKVDWLEKWSNSPELNILVDEIIDHNLLKYKKNETNLGNVLYFGEYNGVVSFFCHSPKDESGYGGRTFTLTLEDNSKIDIKGPWSSRSGVMNRYFTPSIEVSIKDDKGHNYAGNITIELAEKIINDFNLKIKLVKEEKDGDITYNIQIDKSKLTENDVVRKIKKFNKEIEIVD